MEEKVLKTELAKYNLADARIEELKKELLPLKLNSIEDKVSYKLCREKHIEMVSLRTGVEKQRLILNSDARSFINGVNGEAKRLTLALAPIESHLLTQRKIFEDEIQRVKAEKEQKIKDDQKRVQDAQDAKQKELDDKQAELDAETERLRIKEEKIEEDRVATVKAKKDAEDERLKVIEDAKKAKIKVEQDAKDKIARDKQEEIDRKKREEDHKKELSDAKIKDEEDRKQRAIDRIENQKEIDDKILKDKEDADIKAHDEEIAKTQVYDDKVNKIIDILNAFLKEQGVDPKDAGLDWDKLVKELADKI